MPTHTYCTVLYCICLPDASTRLPVPDTNSLVIRSTNNPGVLLQNNTYMYIYHPTGKLSKIQFETQIQDHFNTLHHANNHTCMQVLLIHVHEKTVCRTSYMYANDQLLVGPVYQWHSLREEDIYII